jgi:hypothetical protein
MTYLGEECVNNMKTAKIHSETRGELHCIIVNHNYKWLRI